MIIKITEQLIVNGCRKSCRFCPIANAINALLDQEKFFSTVGQSSIFIKNKDHEKVIDSIPLPFEATKFIRHFDQYLEVQPFEFEIEIPKEYLKEVA